MERPVIGNKVEQGQPSKANLVVLPKFVSNALYIVDLDPTFVTEGLLFHIFSKVGEVLSVKLCTTPKQRSGGSPWLCHAYVNFKTVEEACTAWQTLNYMDLNGTTMRILFSNLDPASRYNKNANLIIKNLEESIGSKALHHTFSALGVVLSCKVQVDRDGKSLGYGFVQFQDEEDAQRAISLVNGRLLHGKQVYLGPFIPRSADRMQAAMNLHPLDLNPAHKTAPAPSRTNMTSAHLLEGRSAAMLGDLVPSPPQAPASVLPLQKGTGFIDVLEMFRKVQEGKEGKVQGTGYFDVSRSQLAVQLPTQLVATSEDHGEAEVAAGTCFFDENLAQLFSTPADQDEAEAQDAE